VIGYHDYLFLPRKEFLELRVTMEVVLLIDVNILALVIIKGC
jgi:hypothetical protein